ncbi:MAG: carbohydrate-binding domain-containing protein [Ruminococcaceae bacterium]|nr:carbohydrate-binding domain-containing protein [Oscillospiraceae bacterium]
MAKSKYTDVVCILIILLMLVVTVLFSYGEELGIEKVERNRGVGSVSYAAVISLSDSETSIHGSGVYLNGSSVVIAHGGEYTVTGSLSNGQLVVEAESGAQVHLVLDGVDIRCADGAALWVKNAGNTVVELAADSENRLVSGAAFSAESLSMDVEGALHSEDDLLLTGQGRLTVENAYSHGIVCKDLLLVESGSFSVNAVGHGIRGRDSVEILGGSFVIRAERDGIQANNDQDVSLGTVNIRSGSFDIEAGQDAIQAETALSITGGDFRIKSGRGSEAAVYAPGSLPWAGVDAALSDSAKGLKAGTDLYIGTGSFYMDCEDDALHCGAALRVEGGEWEIRSGDDALHADISLTVAGGSLRILDAQEGMEAPQLSMEGGEVDIICRNDGLNANGDGPASLSIRGGRLSLCCQGDGLDSNGDILINGGEIFVSAQPSDGNSALDYAAELGCRALVNGGSLVACGFGGMAEAFDAASEQYSVLFHLEETVIGGTELRLLDSEGAELLSYAPEQDYNAVLVSCAELREGERYTLHAGGEKCVVTLTERSTVHGSGGFAAMPPPPGGMLPPPKPQ